MRPAVQAWLLSEGHLVRHEFQTDSGICDLVGCTIDPAKAQHRLELGQVRPLGNNLRVSIWCRMPEAGCRKSIKVEELVESFGGHIAKRTIQEQVDRLLRAGFVRMSRSGGLQKLNGWEPLQIELVAVEMKLQKVTEALAQAERYSLFADSSYVALPAPTAGRALSRCEDSFESAGIGVLAVEPDGVAVLKRAHRIEDTTMAGRIARVHAVERFWPTYLSHAVQH